MDHLSALESQSIYILRENIPIAELDVTRTSARAGRATDHEREDAFERPRAHGDM